MKTFFKTQFSEVLFQIGLRCRKFKKDILAALEAETIAMRDEAFSLEPGSLEALATVSRQLLDSETVFSGAAVKGVERPLFLLHMNILPLLINPFNRRPTPELLLTQVLLLLIHCKCMICLKINQENMMENDLLVVG